jgi:hypothetical protein
MVEIHKIFLVDPDGRRSLDPLSGEEFAWCAIRPFPAERLLHIVDFPQRVLPFVLEKQVERISILKECRVNDVEPLTSRR